MSLIKSDTKRIEREEGTPGGHTFNITLKGDSTPRALCFRSIHGSDNKAFCNRQAGAGTWHGGTGACSKHGGSSVGPLATGSKAVMARVRLQGDIDKYIHMDRAKLLDLTEELAVTKAIFNEFVDNFPDPADEKYGMFFFRFNSVIGTLGSLVEKMSRIDTRNTLTAAQVLYLRATVADILMKYITNPDDRDRAARELASRMGGDVSVEMKPSEFRMIGD